MARKTAVEEAETISNQKDVDSKAVFAHNSQTTKLLLELPQDETKQNEKHSLYLRIHSIVLISDLCFRRPKIQACHQHRIVRCARKA